MNIFDRLMESTWFQPFRPLIHLVAYYPLLLAVPVLLLLFSWDVLMRDYDAFHQLWNETPLTGVLAGFVAATVLGQAVLAVFLLDEGRNDPQAHANWRWELAPRWAYWAAWGLLLVALVLPTVVLKSQFDAVNGDGVKAQLARVWFPAGVLAAVAFFGLLRAVRGAWFEEPEGIGIAVSAVIIAGFVGMSVAHGIWPEMYCPWFPAPVSLLLLFGFVTILFSTFTHYAGRTPFLYPFLIGVFVVPFLVPSLQTEYRVPNMEIAGGNGKSYYDERFVLAKYRDVRPAPPTDRADDDGLDADPAAGARLDAAGQANDRGALVAWHKRTTDKYKEPQPVVLVTVSGGASASAVYCADVLFTLEERNPGFADRIRVVSGASGGMLGAAYFVSQLLPARDGRPAGLIAAARDRDEYREYLAALDASRTAPPGDEAAGKRVAAAEKAYKEMMAGVRAEFFRGLEQDFLGPLMQKWIHRDIPLGVFARSTTNDRGLALEAAWKRHLNGALDVPFRALREYERRGELPSLVLTPMMVEDGRQVIVSNLDLDYMVETARDGSQPGPDNSKGTLSFMGVEFFRMFPKAEAFKLSTAVRMNASFPYLSPSAALPTDPVRHVVDAGYYDNYGTTVATKWVNRHADWLTGAGAKPGDPKRPPEVILLRVQCFGNEGNSLQFVTDKELAEYGRQTGRPAAPDNPVRRSEQLEDLRRAWSAEKPGREPVRTEGGLFALTSPLFGLFSSWRANMVYRADERLGGTLATLNKPGDKGPTRPVLTAYPVRCQTVPSLNWVLSTEELGAIHRNVTTLDDLLRVTNYLNGRSPDRPDTAAGTLGTELGDEAVKVRRQGPIENRAPRASDALQRTPSFQKSLPATKEALTAEAAAAEKFGGFKTAPPVPKK